MLCHLMSYVKYQGLSSSVERNGKSLGTRLVLRYPISNPEPAILCGGLLRFWETPANFARKSVHLDPVLRSTFINRHSLIGNIELNTLFINVLIYSSHCSSNSELFYNRSQISSIISNHDPG